MAEPEDNPLEFFTIDELYEEIARRSDGLVMGVIRKLTDGAEEWFFRFTGSRCLAIGMCERAKHGIINELDLKSEETEED